MVWLCCLLAGAHAARAQHSAANGDSLNAWHRFVGLVLDSGALDDSLAAAKVEIALGRPGRALQLLTPFGDTAVMAPALRIAGSAAYNSQQYSRAAAFFVRAAQGASGRDRGLLLARAGDAYERAGFPDRAAPRYREAGRLLPPIAGWLRIREARATPEPVLAFQLLRGVPPEGQRQAALVRAPLLLAAGDTARAIRAFVAGGAYPEATALALARGDVANARTWLQQALEHASSDSLAVLVAALDAAPWPIPSADDARQLVRLYHRVGRLDDAIRILDRAATSVGDSARLFRMRGELEAETGNEPEAAASYAIAMRGSGPDAALAEYRHALLLRRMGRSTDGWHALESFTRRFPRARQTPAALLLLGERYRSRGARMRTDSVLRLVVTGWPSSGSASRARMELAELALARRDTGVAISWYEREVDAPGPAHLSATAQLAGLESSQGHRERAAALWQTLARADSLGYYGAVARQTLGWAPPSIAPSEGPEADPRAAALAERVALLFAAGFHHEVAAVIAFHRAAEHSSVVERIALGRTLIQHGWPAEGIRIGWQLADTLSLGDARVLRLVFPWPLRSLIEREAVELELDPYFLVGVIRQESAFRPRVVSRAGAHGLMQLMPSTASWLAGRRGLEWDGAFLGVADANLHVGAVHLASLLHQYDGNVVYALAAYNAGGTAVNRWRRTMGNLDRMQFVERIPYPETRNFVRSVLRNEYLYRALYPPGPEHP